MASTALAIGSGAAFGADTLLWRAGKTPNRWAGKLVRGGVEMAVLLGGFLLSSKPAGLTARKTALMGGSGAFVALGVVLLGMAMDKGGIGAVVVLSSVMQAATAFGGGALFFGEKATLRRWAGLAVGSAGIALMG